MILTNKEMRQTSNSIVDGLVESLLNALTKMGDSLEAGDSSELIFKSLNALKLLPVRMLESRLDAKKIANLDIFTPILQCKELENRMDIVAIYLAYCSVHKQLQPIIRCSIMSWSKLLPSVDKLPVADDKGYRPGFYSIVSQLEQVSEITSETLHYIKFDLSSTLLTSWVPQWLSFLNEGPLILNGTDLTPLILDEWRLDFYIATFGDEFILQYVESKNETSPISYFIHKICKRISQFPDWISKSSYDPALRFIAPIALTAKEGSFDLQILMEIVDHPEINYFETPLLVLLLSLALKRIRKTPCHVLHATLHSLGSVQSLPALINMTQYLLSKFLINSGTVHRLVNANSQSNSKFDDGRWYMMEEDLIQVPHWFEETILPPLPPIAKSSFVFDNNSHESENESNGITRVSDLLFESLNLVMLINIDILRQYKLLNIDTVSLGPKGLEGNLNTEHKLTQQYLELYCIPLMTALMLSHQLAMKENKVMGETKTRIISSMLLSASTKSCEELIKTHGNIALYYLIQFISRTSLENLVSQRICIGLLNHLFFHNLEDSIKQMCVANVLSMEALFSYVNLWNDGTKEYERFFTQIFEREQPRVETICRTIDHFIAFLPNHEIICQQKQIEASMASLSMGGNKSPTRQPARASSGNFNLSAQSNKYNPYSAMPFIPSNKTIGHTMRLARNEQMPSDVYPASRQETWNSSNERSSLINPNSVCSDNERYISGINGYMCADSIMEQKNELSNPVTNTGVVPKTPNMTSCTTFSSPWDELPIIHSTPDTWKIVSTGKNYILGGHNRIKNNSRAQSTHIDDFNHEDSTP